MELIGTSTRSYSAVDSGDAAEVAYDIEGAPIPGRKARPIASIHRADTEASTPIVTTDSSSSRTEHTTLAASNAVPPIPASSSSNSNSGTGGGSVSLLSVPATATAANKEGITATENHCDNSAV